MINGMMTLSGAWHKLRDDPILRFLVVSLAFYGMSTFEGPMMAITACGYPPPGFGVSADNAHGVIRPTPRVGIA